MSHNHLIILNRIMETHMNKSESFYIKKKKLCK